MWLAIATFWAARLAWADHLSRSRSIAGRAQAVHLVPASATFYERLAAAHEESGGNPLPALTRAAESEPASAERAIRLGLRAEMAGDLTLAEQNLLRAARLSRLYQPRYLLAQYYFRRGNSDAFRVWAREALRTAYGGIWPLLDLYMRVQPDPGALVAEARTLPPHIRREFLGFLQERGAASAAGQMAEEIAAGSTAADLPDLMGYLDRVLANAGASSAVAVWNLLCERRLIAGRTLDAASGPYLANAGWEHAPSGKGFDWRIDSTSGIRFHHREIELSGEQPEQCVLAWQYAPIDAGQRYSLTADPLPPGVRWTVFHLSREKVWTEVVSDARPRFTAPAGIVRIALTYRRPTGETRFAGAFAPHGLEMHREP